MLCKTEKGLEDEARTAENARALGIPAEVLDARGDRRRSSPTWRSTSKGSVYFPLDAHLSPGRLMPLLRERSADAGVQVSWDTQVTGWRASGGRVGGVHTNRGELVADEYVLCAGAWSRAVVRALGIRLPLEAGKGYSLTLPHPKRLPRVCAILSEAHVAVTPMDGALRFGGTMELAGLDESIDPSRVRGLLKAIPRYLPEFRAADFAGIVPWCGLRPCSPDGLPYVGRFGRFANLSVATGHAMMGLSLGSRHRPAHGRGALGRISIARHCTAQPRSIFLKRGPMKLPWKGVIPAITTPFDPDLRIDHAFLAEHGGALVDAGCEGLVALGSLGEGATLDRAEKHAVVETLVRAVAGRVPVIAGISSLATAEAVSLAREVKSLGATGLMVLPPYVYSTDWREMKAHVAAVLAATDLPCLLYNNPVAYKTDFAPEQVAELASEFPNLEAVKESSADVRRIAAIRALVGDRLKILVGVDDMIVEGIDAGAVGWIAGLVNALPRSRSHSAGTPAQGGDRKRKTSTAGSCPSCAWTRSRNSSS